MAAQSEGTVPYVFLSYSTPDRTQVLALADQLEATGIRVWVDRRDLVGGSRWDASIVDAIAHCTVFALTCSPQSLASPNVQQEVSLAWEERQPILPLLLEQVSVPRELRYPLAGRQWVELLDRPEEAWLPEVLQALAGLGLTPAPQQAALASSPAEPAVGHLPTPLTSFIGREQELAEIAGLLGTTRLLTLSGPGGTGKTRLAIAAAGHVAAAFQDGVWFVDLSGVADPAGVVPAIAQVLNVRESDGRTLAVSLAAYLRSKLLLLVLDNFEQVVQASLVVYDLLAEAPGLRALVTSRVLLRVGGEHVYAVTPLPLPEPDQVRTKTLAHNPAVQLFVERARALRPDFSLTAENAAPVAAICTRLDGLPLAIELAAARIRLLPAPALLARLEQRFRLLIGGERSRPERQQTLRGAIQWSWELLTEPEQVLFRRLAVFAGGWTLAAAEAVCALEDELDVLTGLESLVDKSLLRQGEVDGEPRFTMLSTLCEFGLEQLGSSGEAEELRRAHAEYYCASAERADAAYIRSGHIVADLSRPLDAERDNLLAALHWALERDDGAFGARLAGGLGIWFYVSTPSEGLRWARLLLRLSGAGEATWARARSLVGAGICAVAQGENTLGNDYLEEAAAIFRRTESLPWYGATLSILSALLPATAAARAVQLSQEAIIAVRATDERYLIALTEHFVGVCHLAHLGDLAEPRLHLEGALRLAQALNADWLTMATLLRLATVTQREGRHEEATRLYLEARRQAEALGDRAYLCDACINLALLATSGDDRVQAAAEWRRGLMVAQDLGGTLFTAVCLAGSAGVLAEIGQPEWGARLLAVSDRAWGSTDQFALYQPLFPLVYGPALAATQAALSAEAFAHAWAEGQALTSEQAVTLALETLPPSVPDAATENSTVTKTTRIDATSRRPE